MQFLPAAAIATTILQLLLLDSSIIATGMATAKKHMTSLSTHHAVLTSWVPMIRTWHRPRNYALSSDKAQRAKNRTENAKAAKENLFLLNVLLLPLFSQSLRSPVSEAIWE